MYIKLKAVCNPDNVSDNQDFFKDPARRNIQGYRDYIDEFEEDAAGPANEVLDSLLERFDEHLFRLEEFYVSDGVFHFQWALLHKPEASRDNPSPRRSYATARTGTVAGRPSCVKRLSKATRTCSSVTWRSNVRAITRSPKRLKQCILVSTRLLR